MRYIQLSMYMHLVPLCYMVIRAYINARFGEKISLQ
jgi:hypothetical protein